MHQIFTNATLFTATDENVINKAAVWVDGNHIRYAGPADGLPETPKETVQHDMGGKFIMPGMTETHAHLSFADSSPFAIGETLVEEATMTAVRNARLMVASGFTSAVSFGSTYKIDVALRGAINAGRIIGPRLLAAGRDLGATASNVDSPGGLSQIADGPWALRKAVREQRKLGVDVVKIFIDGEAINPQNPPGELSFTDEEVIAIVDEAHRRRMRVACQTVEKLRAAGIRLVVGGDYGISIAPHGSYAKDLEYFVRLFGMRPAEALICATRWGGEAFDPDGSVGTLTEGSLADLVIVDGDPLEDITVLQDHSRLQVMADGKLYRDLANANPWQVSPNE